MVFKSIQKKKKTTFKWKTENRDLADDFGVAASVGRNVCTFYRHSVSENELHSVDLGVGMWPSQPGSQSVSQAVNGGVCEACAGALEPSAAL